VGVGSISGFAWGVRFHLTDWTSVFPAKIFLTKFDKMVSWHPHGGPQNCLKKVGYTQFCIAVDILSAPMNFYLWTIESFPLQTFQNASLHCRPQVKEGYCWIRNRPVCMATWNRFGMTVLTLWKPLYSRRFSASEVCRKRVLWLETGLIRGAGVRWEGLSRA